VRSDVDSAIRPRTLWGSSEESFNGPAVPYSSASIIEAVRVVDSYGEAFTKDAGQSTPHSIARKADLASSHWSGGWPPALQPRECVFAGHIPKMGSCGDIVERWANLLRAGGWVNQHDVRLEVVVEFDHRAGNVI
jgi:hypothetical protein